MIELFTYLLTYLLDPVICKPELTLTLFLTVTTLIPIYSHILSLIIIVIIYSLAVSKISSNYGFFNHFVDIKT